jgi:hypothetical protein
MPSEDLKEQIRKDAIQKDELDRLSKYQEFQTLVEIFKKTVRACRRHLDDKKTSDWQDVGFYRGQIYFIKTLWKKITSNEMDEN